MALTEKQKKFCDHYILYGNGTQAAIHAGYSEDSAREISSENLTKPAIKDYIAQKQGKLQQKFEITQEKVLQEYAAIAMAKPEEFAAKKMKAGDKVRALDSLARTLGMFNDKVQITGKDGSNIFVFEVPQNNRALAEEAVKSSNGNGKDHS